MGRYAQIKETTNLAVSWVIETAQLHGNKVTTSLATEPASDTTPDTQTPSSPAAGLDTDDLSAKKGRLKSKVRKAATEAAKANVPIRGVKGDREAVDSARSPCHPGYNSRDPATGHLFREYQRIHRHTQADLACPRIRYQGSSKVCEQIRQAKFRASRKCIACLLCRSFTGSS